MRPLTVGPRLLKFIARQVRFKPVISFVEDLVAPAFAARAGGRFRPGGPARSPVGPIMSGLRPVAVNSGPEGVMGTIFSIHTPVLAVNSASFFSSTVIMASRNCISILAQ